MSTGVIITLIVLGAVIVAALVAVMTVPALRAGLDQGGGGSLRRRFGPEYDRAVAHHDGDERAAVRELAERVRRHGSLEIHPLRAPERERYEARWASAQETFVDSPRQAVAEADRLLAELAGARGYPDGDRYEDRLDALSVHHGHHVNGYRLLRRAAQAPPDTAESRTGAEGTEEMREAMVEGRALFEELVAPGRRDAKADRAGGAEREREASDDHRRHPHLPWTFTRHHAKGS